ncbi:MAG: hypothetical protein H0W81_06440 [Chloroflexi bacterium]|nr:hypothetical protein [Chloroflexota bacterium]
MKRQVITICPKTGRTIWTWVDHGPGAASRKGIPIFTELGQRSPGGRKV